MTEYEVLQFVTSNPEKCFFSHFRSFSKFLRAETRQFLLKEALDLQLPYYSANTLVKNAWECAAACDAQKKR